MAVFGALPGPGTMTAPTTRSSGPAATLYDSERGISYVKPSLRGWMHLVWFEAALVLGTLLIIDAHGGRARTATAIYAASVAALFGASALYHRGNWGPAWNGRLQRLDHAMIFVLIAGTTTPIFLLASPNTLGLVSLIVMWSLTTVAITMHQFWMDAPEKLVGGTFLALGAAGMSSIPAVWMRVGTAPALLLVIGALLYAAGAVSYHHRSPDPRPAVFGYHEVFHTYVCLAAACQYVAIGVFLV